MDIVMIILDSMRQDHLGVYGNRWIHTPYFDDFARQSVVFTNGYPESLPTLQVRRALHTGQRVFPFYGHHDYKGDQNSSLGWGPIHEDQHTLAEILGAEGYRSALITDTYHQFKPSKNFHRGFDEWVWIRGQEGDKYRSGPNASRENIESCMAERQLGNEKLYTFLKNYLRNNASRRDESDYSPARVFSEAARWLSDNQDAKSLFLVIDSFDPHEPWDPPDHYRRMYDPDDDCRNVIQSPYCRWTDILSSRELKRIQANYAGEVTMVDHWFGHFWEALHKSDRFDDTMVVVVSDHGHNLGIDPADRGLISKQGHPMTRSVADLVCMIHYPGGEGAGTSSDILMYNMDLTTTILDRAGVSPPDVLDGIDVRTLMSNTTSAAREHLIVGWGPLVTVINDSWWFNSNIWGEGKMLYQVATDPYLQNNLANVHPTVCEKMLRIALHHAGGSIPDVFDLYRTKKWCTPMLNL